MVFNAVLTQLHHHQSLHLDITLDLHLALSNFQMVSTRKQVWLVAIQNLKNQNLIMSNAQMVCGHLLDQLDAKHLTPAFSYS